MESVVLDRTVRQELVDPSMVAEITEKTGAADEVVRRHSENKIENWATFVCRWCYKLRETEGFSVIHE